jgi:hypothetical protein
MPAMAREGMIGHWDDRQLVVGVSNGCAPVVSDAEAWPQVG